jgi:DNA-binding transcriptional regulator LsrR (DeoR family)
MVNLCDIKSCQGCVVMEKKLSDDRAELLADVAEQYFIEGKNQAEIAKLVGVTRSMVSRMLTEARRAGIVNIQIRRPMGFDRELQRELEERFNLSAAFVLNQRNIHSSRIKERIGKAAAVILKQYLKPNSQLGISWGTTVNAVVDAIDPEEFHETETITITQLLGALGAKDSNYDAHTVLASLQRKFRCSAVYLNAPYIVENEAIAQSFLKTKNVADGIANAKKTDVALSSVGSLDISTSSYFLAGYITTEDVLDMVQAGAVGDVCGFQIDEFGNEVCKEFRSRIIGISLEDYLNIPIRIGVAGGSNKALPLLGCLRGGFLNVVVTDADTAQQLLDLDLIE